MLLRGAQDLVERANHGVLQTRVGKVLLGGAVHYALGLGLGQLDIVQTLQRANHVLAAALVETTRLSRESQKERNDENEFKKVASVVG